MKLERTLSIIKPDAVAKNNIGGIIQMLEKAGLQVIAAKMVHMTQEQAEGFYAVHKERPFFGELVDFMTSGPSLVMVLEGEHAVKTNRDVMGATDPKKAAPGTIRATFATSIDANAVHGSDSLENAANEIQYFFTQHNICPRQKHQHQHGCGCSH
ncbi:MAG: nucleoside-diphosphate kinase [Chlamydiales bacterium]|nr:nucleoside-diphosphate kinase [Chlamydiales bacterium]